MPNTDSTRTETVPALIGPVQNFTDAFNRDIGFDTLSIAIDNFTGYWLHVEGAANPYIPPFFVGVIRNVLHASTHPKISWASPFGSSQNPLQIGSFFNATFTNYILPYAPGSLAGLPTSPPGQPGPPPIYVTFDPNIVVNVELGSTTINAIINGICNCISGGTVTPHGAKVVIVAPFEDQLPVIGFTTIPLPFATYDTDGYSDGVGLTIPAGTGPGKGGWYWVGFALTAGHPNNDDVMLRVVQSPPNNEAISTPNLGDTQLTNNNVNNDLMLGPAPFMPLYLPGGTTLILQGNPNNVAVTPNQAAMWIEQMPDRTTFFPSYSALSFPGVASSDGFGNTVATLATVAGSSTVYVDWQLTGGVPVNVGMSLISVSLGIGIPDVGLPNGSAPGTHWFELVPAAPDWEIVIEPQTTIYEPGLTGQGRFYKTP